MNMKQLLICAALAITGCNIGPPKPTVTSRESTGKIQSAQITSGSFTNAPRMTITCDRFVVVIGGSPSVPVGTEGEIITMSNGNKWFSWPGSSRHHPVY